MKESAFTYLNRELSWVEFNARVLGEARQKSVPLLERLRFLTIVSSNFDEFFMVRVASLKAQCCRTPEWNDASGLPVREQLERISVRVHELVQMQYDCLINDILPGLAKEGLHYIAAAKYNPEQVRFLDSFFMSDVFPLLTPLRTKGDGLFPSIGNLRLHAAFLLKNNIAVPTGALADFLETTGVLNEPHADTSQAPVHPPLAIVQIPASIPRIVWLPAINGERYFTLLDDVVRTFGQRLFPGFSIEENLLFKVTRDADFAVDEDRDDDFIAAIQEVLVSRLSSVPVRLICTGESPAIRSFLKAGMGLAEADIYRVPGPMDLATLVELANAEGFDQLRNPPWKNYWPVDIPADVPLWDYFKRTDVLLHVPYNSYEPVLRFINDAADDPAGPSSARRGRASMSPSSWSSRRDSTRSATFPGRTASRKSVSSWCTASHGSRFTPKSSSSSGARRTAYAAMCTCPRETTTTVRRASTSTCRSLRRTSRSPTTRRSFST